MWEIQMNPLNQKEALRYLGYGQNTPPENILKIMRQCEQELMSVIQPRFVYKIFDLEKNHQNQYALVNCALSLEGDSIQNHLQDCTKAMVLCATISSQVDRLLRQTEIRDMTMAVIMDALASVAIEQVCDTIEEKLAQEMKGWYFTWRFGVGYGDFPLSLQKQVVAVTDASKRIGLHVNESDILTPRKSITCVIGMSQKMLGEKIRGCAVCNLKDSCVLRANGSRCHW